MPEAAPGRDERAAVLHADATLLVVDDEPYVRNALARSLRRTAGRVLLAADAEQAAALLDEHDVDLVIADHGLPGQSGLDLLARCRERHPDARRVLITGHRDFPLMREAIDRAGVSYFLTKPWDPEALRRLVDDLVTSGADAPATGVALLPGAEAKGTDDILESTAQLARILSTLNAVDAVGEIVTGIASELARLVPTRECGWWDEETGRLWRLAGGAAPLDDEPFDALDDDLAGALTHGRAATGPIVLGWTPRGTGGPQEALSILLVPVRHRGRTLGVLTLVSAAPLADDSRLLALAAAIAEPVAVAVDRARLREFVAQEKALWESAFDAIADPVLIIGEDGQVVRANRSARAGFERASSSTRRSAGAPECEPVRCHSLCRPDGTEEPEGCPLDASVCEGRELRGLFGHPDRSYVVSSFPIVARDGQPPRRVRIYHDVTQERALQRQLSRSEQLSTVGKLAAGVAHEIRNPLAAMTNAISLLRSTPALDDEEKQLIEIVLDESRRVNRIVGDFLSFARPGRGRFASAQMGELVESTLALLGKDPRCGERVALSFETTQGLPDIVMDCDQVRQVIWNLCLNAVQAVGRHGTVSVRVTRQRERGQDGVRVDVRDDGAGLGGADGGVLFDPFETTKPNGTGLGLSMARHIVELHRGWIRLEDARPGTCASFWLPVDRQGE